MSSFPTAAWTIGVILAAMALIALIEVGIPLHARNSWNRAHLKPNLALTFITFATNLPLNAALIGALALLEAKGFGLLRWASLGPVTAGILGFVLLDFSFYAAHVVMHKVPAFWRAHSVHHSDPVVDVTTSIRQHPTEGLIRYAFMGAFACVLGVGLVPFMLYRVASALNGLLEHANIRIPQWLDRVLVTVTTWPNMHKIHHSRDVIETDSNYGNIFSWFDFIFGTYTPSLRGETVVCGLHGTTDAALQTTPALLAMPFRAAASPGAAADSMRPA
jgi:sterol desaturase/sphingolipid hydroxylase (fatty acid hydroxylase superfamily)